MKNYYIVRHGETPLNVSGVFYGHTDCPLNETGEEQARYVGKLLAKVPFHRVISSNLQRAKRTRDLILEANEFFIMHGDGNEEHTASFFLEEDERLKEISCGLWEGLSVKEIEERYPEAWKRFTEGWPTARMPEGECFEDLYLRVEDYFLKELQIEKKASDADIENVLIVGHHGSIGPLFLKFMDLEPKDYWKLRIEQGVYGLVTETDGEYIIKKINTKEPVLG